MDENPQQQSAGDDEEKGKEPDLEFDPEQIENDPAQNPPIPELKDLKGG